MTRVVLRTGQIGTDGKEEILQEFLCDWPDCANIAEHVVGVVVELRAMVVLCREHAAMMQKRPHDPA